MPPRLAQLHAQVRASRALQRFTATTRVLLAVGFVGPGLLKLFGPPFGGGIPEEHPIGAFFALFYSVRAWYLATGAVQVVAGLLLLWPRTALLGALVYLPVMVNITLITLSLGFGNTSVITVLMLLAVLYLLAWDADRLAVLVAPQPSPTRPFRRREYLGQSATWGGLAGGGFGALALLFGHDLTASVAVGLTTAFALAGTLFGAAVAWHLRRASRATTSPSPAQP